MEQWGTGIQRVFEQVAEAGLPEPVIEEIQDRVRVTIYVPSHDPAKSGEHANKSGVDGGTPSKPGDSPSQRTKSLSRVTKSEHQVTKSSHQVGARSQSTKAPR
ncbi:ATP-binding protein [Actinomyces qiguomingii]|uniref:ATP-binding protein n=1 Tax=Actinomyces qiguomingii TaxID=2057800 RepID=UPI001E598CB2|nr:ATP-binding protein [Actinomyces qiguomingii]